MPVARTFRKESECAESQAQKLCCKLQEFLPRPEQAQRRTLLDMMAAADLVRHEGAEYEEHQAGADDDRPARLPVAVRRLEHAQRHVL